MNEDGSIGLLHRYKGGRDQWELPGGKIEQNETAKQAATRELEEELGVVVSIEREIGSTDFVFDENTFHYTWFLGEVSGQIPSVKEPEAFDTFGYFSFEELEHLKLSENMKKLVVAVKNGEVIF